MELLNITRYKNKDLLKRVVKLSEKYKWSRDDLKMLWINKHYSSLQGEIDDEGDEIATINLVRQPSKIEPIQLKPPQLERQQAILEDVELDSEDIEDNKEEDYLNDTYSDTSSEVVSEVIEEKPIKEKPKPKINISDLTVSDKPEYVYCVEINDTKVYFNKKNTQTYPDALRRGKSHADKMRKRVLGHLHFDETDMYDSNLWYAKVCWGDSDKIHDNFTKFKNILLK